MSHEYDSGFLTAIPGYANSLTYHDNLALASVAHSNGVTDWVGQDPDRMMRPAALWTSGVAGEENWNSGSYQFDGSGNIKAIGAQRFRYDAVSRLVEAKIWVPENNPPLNSFDDGFETGDTCNWEVRNAASGCVAGAHQLGLETYTYDPYGNLIARTTETSDGATQLNTPADPQTNRLQGASTYDDEGNMTGWNGADYDFDALGQMVRMRNGNQDWLFAYSTGGERILQVAEGGLGEKRWTVRDAAGRVLREWVAPAQGSPSWTRDWVYRGTQILATVEPQRQELLDQAEGETSQVVQGAPLGGAVEVVRHLTLDHLGTPRLVTDEAGTNLAFHIYWPYGEEASDPLQNELRKKFTGHERDSYDLSSLADELDYMRARFASPTVGRFLSMDPHRGGVRSPQSWNRFSYVAGSPISNIDPTGRSCGTVSYDGKVSWQIGSENCTVGGTATVTTNREKLVPGNPLINGGYGNDSGVNPGWLGNPFDRRWELPRVGKDPGPDPNPNPNPREPRPRIFGDCSLDAVPALPPGESVVVNVLLVEAASDGASSGGGILGAGAVAAAAALLTTGPWDYKDQNPPGFDGLYDAGTNFNYGAVMAAAGVPYELAIRGGGVINVIERALKGNFEGAGIAAEGLFGLGRDGASLGDEDSSDLNWIKAGYIYATLCL